MVKKIHLSLQDIKQKIHKLQVEKMLQEVQKNKTKRKRIYAQLAKLQKALEAPEEHVVDPEQEQARLESEKNKRIQKKLQRKQQELAELKNKKRHQKRCLKCGSREHLLSECPTTKGGFCYKCGSQDHSHKECEKEEYTMADCFYCGQKGHIARDCPTNQKGLYKKGGSCFGCGSVRHTMKNCPERLNKSNKAGTFKNTDQF